MAERTYVCSIAGYDPSAGAGVSADLKTFEMHGLYGFGVVSALTWQNDEQVARVQWLTPAEIQDQLALLVPRFKVDFYKIGIMQNLDALLQLTGFIKQLNPGATIVWDPVLRASSKHPFFQGPIDFERLLGQVDWITPNLYEFEKLFGGKDGKALELSRFFSILKKGGHDLENKGRDILFYQGQAFTLEPSAKEPEALHPKHGSGCVLSAALCANLAKGAAAVEACQLAKRYIEQFLASHPSLLGWHQRQNGLPKTLTP